MNPSVMSSRRQDDLLCPGWPVRMDIHGLRYLVAAADAGNITRAARLLSLNASTVSRRITRLEDHLGLTLFERGRFGVRLTTGGTVVLRQIRRALADLDAVLDAGRCGGNGRWGAVRLGVRMPPIGEPLRGLLAKWRQSHTNVSLTLHEMSDHDLYTSIEARHLDVALLVGYGTRSNVVMQPLYRERLFVALPSEHRLSEAEALNWCELSNETMLVQDWPGSHATREFYACLTGSRTSLVPHATGKQSVFALVGAGFGITLAVESQAQVSFPGLVFRPIAENNAYVDVNLAWAVDAEDAVVGHLIAFLRDEMRSRTEFAATARSPKL